MNTLKKCILVLVLLLAPSHVFAGYIETYLGHQMKGTTIVNCKQGNDRILITGKHDGKAWLNIPPAFWGRSTLVTFSLEVVKGSAWIGVEFDDHGGAKYSPPLRSQVIERVPCILPGRGSRAVVRLAPFSEVRVHWLTLDHNRNYRAERPDYYYQKDPYLVMCPPAYIPPPPPVYPPMQCILPPVQYCIPPGYVCVPPVPLPIAMRW